RSGAERQAAPGAEGLARSRRAAMRLLPERHDDGGGLAPEAEAEADRCRYRRGDDQYLPLRDLSARARCDPRCCQQRLKAEAAMGYVPRFNRRSFVVGSSTAVAGLALGLKLPFGPEIVRADDGSPEIDAWVVIRSDETVVIRIARS